MPSAVLRAAVEDIGHHISEMLTAESLREDRKGNVRGYLRSPKATGLHSPHGTRLSAFNPGFILAKRDQSQIR
jgi:hypothetical protein